MMSNKIQRIKVENKIIKTDKKLKTKNKIKFLKCKNQSPII